MASAGNSPAGISRGRWPSWRRRQHQRIWTLPPAGAAAEAPARRRRQRLGALPEIGAPAHLLTTRPQSPAAGRLAPPREDRSPAPCWPRLGLCLAWVQGHRAPLRGAYNCSRPRRVARHPCRLSRLSRRFLGRGAPEPASTLQYEVHHGCEGPSKPHASSAPAASCRVMPCVGARAPRATEVSSGNQLLSHYSYGHIHVCVRW